MYVKSTLVLFVVLSFGCNGETDDETVSTTTSTTTTTTINSDVDGDGYISTELVLAGFGVI